MNPQYSLRLQGDRLERGEFAGLEARQVFVAQPRRIFRWHRGQRHYSGRYWAATMGAFVGYESRLELAVLLLLDFDPEVVRVSSQPFEVIADRGDRQGSHVPDYMVEHADGSFTVIDVKPVAKQNLRDVADALHWAEGVIQARGWAYSIASEPDPVLLSNVRFLAGYRRTSQFDEDDLHAARESTADARTLGDAMRRTARELVDGAYARSVVLHLLWCHAIRCDLARPLAADTILEVA